MLAGLADELGTTDRTLRRAVGEGLIRATRTSPRKLDLPPAERAYLRANWALLAGLRSALRTEPGVRLAVLFGSRARGDHRTTSDVDLLVDLVDPSKRLGLIARLERTLGLTAQLVLLEDARGAPLLLEQVTRDGRVLIDRVRGWPEITREAAAIGRAAARERRRIDAEFDATFEAKRAE